MRYCIVALAISAGACVEADEPVQQETETVPVEAEVGPQSPQLTRAEVFAARQEYEIEVLSFDDSQDYGAEFPYSDRMRIRITNGNEAISLPCLTVLTKRYRGSEMIGSSRNPPIPTRDIPPGASVEYDHYPRGRLGDLTRMEVEIEQIIAPESEQFICELKGL